MEITRKRSLELYQKVTKRETKYTVSVHERLEPNSPSEISFFTWLENFTEKKDMLRDFDPVCANDKHAATYFRKRRFGCAVQSWTRSYQIQ